MTEKRLFNETIQKWNFSRNVDNFAKNLHQVDIDLEVDILMPIESRSNKSIFCLETLECGYFSSYSRKVDIFNMC